MALSVALWRCGARPTPKAHGLEELRDMKKAVTAAAAFAPPDVSATGALDCRVLRQHAKSQV